MCCKFVKASFKFYGSHPLVVLESRYLPPMSLIRSHPGLKVSQVSLVARATSALNVILDMGFSLLPTSRIVNTNYIYFNPLNAPLAFRSPREKFQSAYNAEYVHPPDLSP